MMMDYRVYLMSVDLHGIQTEDENLESFIKRKGTLFGLNDSYGVDISRVFYCGGLLLCITSDNIKPKLVVWNPYCGHKKRIRLGNSYHRLDRYALGYDKKNKFRCSHKVLRFRDDCHVSVKQRISEFEIYNLSSDSWKVVDFNPDWDIEFYQRGVSLKGDTYWLAQEKLPLLDGQVGETRDFLICFDFTRERFGPRLPLPFQSHVRDSVTLSSVGGNQLAVLRQGWGTWIKIWITTKIEANEVSWGKLFLAFNTRSFPCFQFQIDGGSFFLDEKKKVVVVLGKDKDRANPTRNIAYIIGKKGYFKQVDLGESAHKHCCPFVCSYVPCSVHIKQAAGKTRCPLCV